MKRAERLFVDAVLRAIDILCDPEVCDLELLMDARLDLLETIAALEAQK